MWQIPSHPLQTMSDMACELGCLTVRIVHSMQHPAFTQRERTNQPYQHVIDRIDLHIKQYGGRRVDGYYFMMGLGTTRAVKHAMWYDTDNNTYHNLIPNDTFSYVWFAPMINNDVRPLDNYYYHGETHVHEPKYHLFTIITHDTYQHVCTQLTEYPEIFKHSDNHMLVAENIKTKRCAIAMQDYLDNRIAKFRRKR